MLPELDRCVLTPFDGPMALSGVFDLGLYEYSVVFVLPGLYCGGDMTAPSDIDGP